MKFRSSLREVMFFIKYSKDKEALDRILMSDAGRFRRLERRAADVIRAVTNSGITYDEEEEMIDMCQAIQDMRLESRNIGRAEGVSIGESQKAQQVAKNMYALKIDIDQIAQCVGYTAGTVRHWLGLAADEK